MKSIHFLIFSAVFFSICLMGTEKFLYEVIPIEGGTVEVSTSGNDKINSGAILNGKPGNEAVFSTLLGTKVIVTFDKPRDMRQLAIVGIGWGDWAIPSKVSVAVNGGEALVYDLKGDPMDPDHNPPTLPADVLYLSEDAIATTRLEITVLDVKTTGNRHGAFKLGIPGKCSCQFDIDLNQFYKADSVTVTISNEEPISGIVLRVNKIRYCNQVAYDYILPDMEPGTHRYDIPWQVFVSQGAPEDVCNSTHILTMEMVLPKGVKKFPEIEVIPGRIHGERADFWSTVKPIDFTANEDGWRQGIPSDGFGRFGYIPDNGLLSFNYDCMHNALYLSSRIGGNGGSYTLYFDSSIPRTLNWERIHANSVGTFRYALMPFVGAKENKIESKAFGVFDQSLIPERQISSVLAPGIVNWSADPIFAFYPASSLGNVWLLLPIEKGQAEWVKMDSQGAFPILAEGWMVAVFEKCPQTPVLFALEKQPKNAALFQTGLALDFGAPRGHIGIGLPMGIRVWNGSPGKIDDDSELLAEKARTLAAILRAYPTRSNMTFKDLGDKIHIREQFGHYSWKNDWQETGMAVAPLPPMLAFAEEMGYPVEYPHGAPEFQLSETKYGMYRYWKGGNGCADYVLPIPDVSRKIYPKTNAELAPVVVKNSFADRAIDGNATRPASWEGSLVCWWMYAAMSQMQAYLDQEQRRMMSEKWKVAIDYVMDGHTWYLRREPYSGAEYPISFAWMDTGLQILGDPNSGIGASLCGLDSYAEFSGDWATIEKYWDAIGKIPYFFLYCHDWTMMQTGCREHTSDSCIDMDVIAYEGVAAYLRMAKVMNKPDDIAVAKLLVARLGVSGVIKWFGPQYGHPGMTFEDYKTIGDGYSEFGGFSIKQPRNSDSAYINGEVALCFSWDGNFPSWYTLLLEGNGHDFWHTFQYNMVEKQMNDWRKAHPGHRNWHDANVAAHLYMRLLLNPDEVDIAKEFEINPFFKDPYPRLAAENAAFYALVFGCRTPVVMKSYGRAVMTAFDWNQDDNSVTVEFEAPDEENLGDIVFELKKTPVSGPEEPVSLKPGINTITWTF